MEDLVKGTSMNGIMLSKKEWQEDKKVNKKRSKMQ